MIVLGNPHLATIRVGVMHKNCLEFNRLRLQKHIRQNTRESLDLAFTTLGEIQRQHIAGDGEQGDEMSIGSLSSESGLRTYVAPEVCHRPLQQNASFGADA